MNYTTKFEHREFEGIHHQLLDDLKFTVMEIDERKESNV